MLTPRSKTLRELVEGSRFFFTSPTHYQDPKNLLSGLSDFIEELLPILEECSPFEKGSIEHTIKRFCTEKGFELKRVAQPLRVALTGATFSPGLFEIIALLGKREVVKRLLYAKERRE